MDSSLFTVVFSPESTIFQIIHILAMTVLWSFCVCVLLLLLLFLLFLIFVVVFFSRNFKVN